MFYTTRHTRGGPKPWVAPTMRLNSGGFCRSSAFTTNLTGSLTAFLSSWTPPSDGGTVTVSLYSDSDGQPGQLLDTVGTIRDSALSTSGSLVDLPAPLLGAPQLTAGTEYWIVVSSSATSGALWFFDSSDAGYGAYGQSYEDRGAVHADAQGPYNASVGETVQGSLSADYDTTGQPSRHGYRDLYGSAGFSFSNASASSLNEVGLYLADATPSDGGSVTVSLFSDDGGRPGQSIATLGVIDDKNTTNAATLVKALQAPAGLRSGRLGILDRWPQDSAGGGAVWF